MKKLTLLVDMDGILVDLLAHWLSCIALDTGIVVNPSEVDGWAMEKHPKLAPLGLDGVLKYLHQDDFFLNAPWLPGAHDGLKKLYTDGHDVNIVSSPSGPISAKEKYQWFKNQAPWFPSKNIMLANRKTLVRGDVLIDDHPQTGLDYVNTWPEAIVMAIGYSYNKNLTNHSRIYRVNEYPDTQTAWEQICCHVDLIAAERSRRAIELEG